MFEEDICKGTHSLQEIVLGKGIALKKVVELDETVALFPSEDCLSYGHHFIDLLILDA